MMRNVQKYLNFMILLCSECWSLQNSDVKPIILPEVAFTKTTKIKVSLILSNTLPSGTTVSANCSLTLVANFSDECTEVPTCRDRPQHIALLEVKRLSAKELSPSESGDISTVKPGVSETIHGQEKWTSSTPQALFLDRDTTTALDHSSTKDPEYVTDVNSWTLDRFNFLFTDSVAAQDVVAVRSQFPSEPKTELLRVRCHLAGYGIPHVFESHSAQTASALLVAELKPTVAIDWPETTVLGEPLDDRPYPNPAYVEVSPCPCDLTSGSCNINCCCDKDCLSSDLNTFLCIEGLGGGIQTPKLVDHFCELQPAPHSDWFPLLCVVWNSSAYLGWYFVHSPLILRTTKSFKSQVQKLPFKDFWSSPQRSVSLLSDSYVYQYGSPILTVVGAAEQQGYLSLPVRTFNGQCTETSPLGFLVPQVSSCNVQLTIASCSEASSFSATTYLGSDGDLHVLSRMGQLRLANVSIMYRCRGNSVGEQASTDCHPSDPKPVYDSQTGRCRNAVLRVKYLFLWNGPEIVNVNVTVVMGDLLVTNGSLVGLYVTQRFEAEFLHSGNQIDDSGTFGNDTGDDVPFVRSGNPGYDVGRTLITGIPKDVNGSLVQSITDFAYMDINPKSSIRLLQPIAGGRCGVLGRPVPFGVSSYSGCHLEIPGHLVDDCGRLRSMVLKFLCSLVPSTYVSRGGNPDQDSLSEYVSIIREDACQSRFSMVVTTDDDDGNVTGACAVVSHLSMTVLYATAVDIGNNPVYQVRGMRIISSNSTWPKCRNPSERMTAGCRNDSAGDRFSLFVTSSVDFVKTPANLNPNTKRFWIIQNSLPCSQDSCWTEIGYPFTAVHTGDERAYVTRWGLVLGAVAAFSLLMTRAYW